MDPRWINAKFDGKDDLGAKVTRGTRVLYYPNTKTVMQGERAEQAWRDFQAAIADEEAYQG